MGNVVEILDQGFACLVDHLGVIEAEYFISLIKRVILTIHYGRGNILIKWNLASLLQRHLPMLTAIHLQEKRRYCSN